jgi:galactonate dehydratase
MTKVRAISTLVVNARLRNWIFVKIETDEPGLVGWGEASLEWKTRAVVGAIEDLAPLVVGADPMQTEFLWQALFRQHFFKGGVVTMSAISGIDQALHDVKAKMLGVPLYELLGGRVRDRIRLYDHLGGGDSTAVYEDMDRGAFAERAQASIDDGFTALKILPVPPSAPLDSNESIRKAVELTQAVRDAVGPNIDVMVDFHGRTTPAMAIQYAHALREYQPWFLEEPCQPGNVEAIMEVARAVRIPIATGERLVTRWEFRELLEKRACAVIQPDVCHCGGVAELRRIAAMAETYDISVAPHNPLGPIATAVNLHVSAAIPNFLIQELMRADVPWRADIVDQPLVITGGYADVPQSPGIGISVDEGAAAAHPYAPEPELRVFHDDGAVADW